MTAFERKFLETGTSCWLNTKFDFCVVHLIENNGLKYFMNFGRFMALLRAMHCCMVT